MKVVTIIQARMGSSRLPGKVLMDLGGEPVLARVFNRSRRARLVHQTIIATSTLRADDLIVAQCNKLGAAYWRGSEENVLERYYFAASHFSADVVVRITSDNPLVDPDLVDQVVAKLLESGAEYVNNRSPRTYPQGLDVEACTMPALRTAWKEAKDPYQLEHVTPYFYQHPELFHCASVRGAFDCSHHRWTLDTIDDLTLIREIYARLGNRDEFSWSEALAMMEAVALPWMSSNVIQKSAH